MKRIQRKANVIADEVDGSTMLCDTASVEFFRLNSTGALVWEICEARTVGDIAKHLTNVYPASDPDMLWTEVERFVKSLTEAGLVTFEDDQKEIT